MTWTTEHQAYRLFIQKNNNMHHSLHFFLVKGGQNCLDGFSAFSLQSYLGIKSFRARESLWKGYKRLKDNHDADS